MLYPKVSELSEANGTGKLRLISRVDTEGSVVQQRPKIMKVDMNSIATKHDADITHAIENSNLFK